MTRIVAAAAAAAAAAKQYYHTTTLLLLLLLFLLLLSLFYSMLFVDTQACGNKIGRRLFICICLCSKQRDILNLCRLYRHKVQK